MKQRTRLICLATTLACAGVALAEQARAPTVPPNLAGAASAQAATMDAATAPRIGETVDPRALHPVRRPGLYGLSSSPEGSSYGVIGGKLIRYDPRNMRVQSIVRQVDEILD